MIKSNEATIELGSSQYRTVHNWLNRHYGKAALCENSNCLKTSTAFEWALKKGYQYAKKKDNFLQLCTSCHRKYDFSENCRAVIKENFKKGRQARKKPVIKLDAGGKQLCIYESVAKAAKEIGCAHPSILKAISRQTKVRGFKWQWHNSQTTTNE